MLTNGSKKWMRFPFERMIAHGARAVNPVFRPAHGIELIPLIYDLESIALTPLAKPRMGRYNGLYRPER